MSMQREVLSHCYKPTVIKSDDTYRVRRDCVICKKQFYSIKDRTSPVDVNNSRIAGDLLIQSGTPYLECGICELPHRLHESKKVRLFVKFTNPDKDIFDGYQKLPPEITWVNDPILGAIRTVKERSRMVILSVPGCPKCWGHQDLETGKLGKPHIYGAQNNKAVEKPLAPSTTVLKAIEAVTVIPTRWETQGRTKVQRWGLSREQDDQPVEKELKRGLYGPYNDRKGK